MKQKTDLTFMDVLRFVGGYWRRQPVRLGVSASLFMGAAFVETYLPNALSSFLGVIKQQASSTTIWLYLAFFLGIYFLQIGLRGTGFFIYNKFETRLFKDFFDEAFIHVHSLSEQFFLNTFSGSLISKITRARGSLESLEDQIFHRILPTFVIFLGTVFFLGLRFPSLALLVTLSAAVLFGLTLSMVVWRMRTYRLEAAAAQDAAVANLADSLSGIATSKAYAQEESEIRAFKINTETLRLKTLVSYHWANMIWVAQCVLVGAIVALLLGGGTWMLIHGKATIEDLAYLTLTYTILQSYLRDLGYNIRQLVYASYELHGAMELMRETPHVVDAPHAPEITVSSGAIRFSGVRFAYPGKETPVFQDFSLSIRGGERVALVGPSGSGKTTFLRLLQRAYEVQSGTITIDGQNIATHTQKSLRSLLALVPQDPILFHRSLRENIAYARPDAPLEAIRAAASHAHIDAFIMSLPDGYDTMVGERGVKLSGGERQRVAIARAILANRPILLLDEATSSLDSTSEKAIQEALHTLIQGRTSIMVAHRLSTILDADRILVFDKGKIVEEGTHAELLAQDGLYASLFHLQSGGFIGGS